MNGSMEGLALAEGRTRWTDDRLDDVVASLNRQIDDLPDRVKGIEGKLDNVAEDTRDCNNEIKSMHKEFRASRQGLTRGERIALFGATAGFIGSIAAAVAVILG